ncbi:uncharacterized protein FA14DRAFT_95111 [Meira miltonrushii]|uniref:Glycosyl transferase family 25 domain-containing protein n=1 Tax=Meira miltonrushii TaxID=1280837 RepID=A0A316V1G3_9BASI|nr:uncharacterized protein FA14DRAFT_95111 [Meira miltonrushii]PWN31386.1 hypothetical protein FA14DRAFT_95111 [Meira miltonrushii]
MASPHMEDEESYMLPNSRVMEKKKKTAHQHFSTLKFSKWQTWTFGTVVTLALVWVFFHLGSSKPSTSIPQKSDWNTVVPERVSLPNDFSGPYTSNTVNSTLGFGKIFVIHLPYRSDKKDQLLMMSRLQGIDMTFINARTPSELKQSGLPWQSKEFQETRRTGVASWRSHSDAIQAILENDLSSALILEDDGDWDMDVKYQMAQLHQPFATLINSFNKPANATLLSSTKDDPWLSSEWDVINFGTCLDQPFGENDHIGEIDLKHPPLVAYEDKTLADLEDTLPQNRDIMNKYNYTAPSRSQPNAQQTNGMKHRRLAILTNKAVCLNGYAVSRKGAMKLLYHYSKGITEPIDLAYAGLSNKGLIRSWSVIPAIMTQWKIQDSEHRNSDIFFPDSGKFVQEADTSNHNPWVGHAPSLKNSARRYIKELVESNRPF